MRDHDLLRTFIAIADAGSFTAASETVGRTPSAVSMQMRKLEEQIGAPLFERSAQGVRATARGELLLIHARRILRAHQEATEALVQSASGETVTIGIPQEYVPSRLPQVLGVVGSANLPVSLRIICEPSHELLRRLDENAVDLAIVTEFQVGDERGEVIGSERALWVSAEDAEVATFDPLPLAVDTEGCAFRRAALEILASENRRHRLAVIGQHPVVRSAVLAGSAIGLIPESTFLPGMKELTTADGFSALPSVQLRLRRSRNSRTHEVDRIFDLLIQTVCG